MGSSFLDHVKELKVSKVEGERVDSAFPEKKVTLARCNM